MILRVLNKVNIYIYIYIFFFSRCELKGMDCHYCYIQLRKKLMGINKKSSKIEQEQNILKSTAMDKTQS